MHYAELQNVLTTFSHNPHIVRVFGLGARLAGALIQARLRVRAAVPERARPAAVTRVLAVEALRTLEAPVPRIKGIRPAVTIFARHRKRHRENNGDEQKERCE